MTGPHQLINSFGYFIGTEVYSKIVDVVDENCDVYIAADSTFGSSVDDISAAHVDSDLLIYFGSDMSASASIPVMVIPKQKPANSMEVVNLILDAIRAKTDVDPSSNLLIFDPSYTHVIKKEHARLADGLGQRNIGILPLSVDIDNWTPGTVSAGPQEGLENVGGLLFPREVVAEASGVIYIGEKQEQLVSVLLRLSGCDVTAISPQADNACVVHRGVDSKEYRERYVGVMRVEEAEIIGIIVGSMGLSDTVMHALVSQLQALIHAAGKKSYCFVMGRLNEAKLCNFPEVHASPLLLVSPLLIVSVFVYVV